MAKKTTENEVELTPEIDEVQPVQQVEPTQLLRGYIRIVKKGSTSGKGVVINANSYGEEKTYKPSEWEIVDAKKK